MSWNGVFKGYYADVCWPAIFFFLNGRWEDGCKESQKLRDEGVTVPEICEIHIQSDVGLRRLRHMLRNIDPP